MTMHGRRLRRITALLTGGALVGGALLAAPLGARDPRSGGRRHDHHPEPRLRGRGLRGLGHEPRLVRQRHRRLPRRAPRGALRRGVRRGRPQPQHRALQHRRRQRPGRPGLPARRRRGRGLVEPDARRPDAARHDLRRARRADWWDADDPATTRTATPTRPSAGGSTGSKDQVTHWETFSNSPPWFLTESGYVSGGFDAATPTSSKTDDRGGLRRPTSCASPSSLEDGARHRVRHPRPVQRAQHQLLGHHARRRRPARPAAARRAPTSGPQLPAAGDHGARAPSSTSRPPRPTRRSRPWTRPTRASSPRTGTPRPRTSRDHRRPAQRAHLRHRRPHSPSATSPRPPTSRCG